MKANEAIPSRTYKLRVSTVSAHPLYFTVVGIGAQIEALFINTKELEKFYWLPALLTAYTRQLQNGTPAALVIQDMMREFDPRGGYPLEDGSGRFVNSVMHHLGLVLGDHTSETAPED